MIDENTIEKAPRCIHVGNKTYILPTEEQYEEGGYYELIETPQPKAKKWYNLVAKYALVDNKIQQNWDYVKVEKPDYTNLVVTYIRKKYSLNDELAILRQVDNSEEKKQEFDKYKTYCDECKEKAKKDVKSWTRA